MNLSPVRHFLFFLLCFVYAKGIAQKLVIQRGDQELLASYRFDESEERLFSWSVSGRSVRMWDTRNGRLMDEFYLDNASMITSVAYSDATGRLACVTSGNTLQTWQVRTRESGRVPLEIGDMFVQAKGSQLLVFSNDRVKIFDGRDLSFQ